MHRLQGIGWTDRTAPGQVGRLGKVRLELHNQLRAARRRVIARARRYRNRACGPGAGTRERILRSECEFSLDASCGHDLCDRHLVIARKRKDRRKTRRRAIPGIRDFV